MYCASYHSLGIAKQLHVHLFVMYQLFSLYTQKQNTHCQHSFAVALPSYVLCIIAFIVLFVVCTILWENESLQLYNFSNQNKATETFSCANIFLKKG